MSQSGTYLLGTGAGIPINTITGNSGGVVSPDGVDNINIVGSGVITVTGNPGTNTLTISDSGLIPSVWTEKAASFQIVPNNNYICNGAALVVATLPPVAAQGDVFHLVGKGVGLYTIANNALQSIHFDGTDTAVGILGSIASTGRRDAIYIVCTTANTEFTVLNSTGNFLVS